MIKKIQIELSLFSLLLATILFTYKVDVWVYNFFSNINYGYGSTYLRKFFVGITDIGDSLWYFLIFVLIFLFSYLARKKNFITLEKYFFLRGFVFFGFVYLLLVGVVTQVLKHIIGRPRPNHTLFDGSFEFSFFSTESALHSFPSGHSSTIVAIAILVALIVPSLKYFFYIFGGVIALSRVVVGAHFFSDVLAGALIAIITYKIFDHLIKKKYPIFKFNRMEINNISKLTKATIIFMGLGVLTAFGPEIDIFLSGLFYLGNNQFLVQSYYFTSIAFRKILLPLLLLYIFLLPVCFSFLPIHKAYFNYKFSFSEVVFVWLSGTFTILLNVNILLKNMWGRARPNDIVPFGGAEEFTPWYKIGDTCVSNCSFVSGDASVGFLLIVFYFITMKNAYLYLAIAMGVLLGIIRVVAGGHFFSDIIFSQIVVTASIYVCFSLYKKLYDK